MTSLDMVIVRSLVDRGPIVLSDEVAWPWLYQKTNSVDISEVLPSPNHPSLPFLIAKRKRPSIIDSVTQEKPVALSQKPARLFFKQLLLTKIGLKCIKSQIVGHSPSHLDSKGNELRNRVCRWPAELGIPQNNNSQRSLRRITKVLQHDWSFRHRDKFWGRPGPHAI
jgi:hypothetical protein